MLKGKPLHLVNDLINASDEIVAIKVNTRKGVEVEYLRTTKMA